MGGSLFPGEKMEPDRTADIAAEVVDESDLAWCLDDGDTEAWVPKSLVEDNGDGTFTMPQWLAKKKRFI